MKHPFISPYYLSADASFSESRGVILGCPFDGTASFRPGARFGPDAIRRASWGMETYSPYFRKDLGRLPIHDMGDLELPLGDKQASLRIIRQVLREILSKKKFPISLGGDHLVTLPIVEELRQAHPNLHLLHLDAHTDLRDNYLGETLSHSTVIKRIVEILGTGRLFQIGIRSGTEEEFQTAKKMRSIVSLEQRSLRSMVRHLKGKPVYITLDLDIFDPSLLPGVGTPEPGGLMFQGFLSLLRELRSLRVIGFDLVELTPDYDPTQVSAVTASVVLREMILAFCRP
jgi:agmatinase